ncbi:MAG: TRAP transporter large permease [Candidatus Thiodiazotropha sp. (ex Lucinoma kastoroae)]|nr:TRAP transporter large permease [Candidatus Thiodiazotropha sp. (ex Lucinoma kastoroae)]MCU7860102.1 TRAP transporter large permease [Candidatus Thiodiazotropha sp. (ex Lucinoma kastoroae)]
MDPLILGLLAAVTLVFLLLIGMPVAFALGFTAIIFLLIQDGVGAFDVVADTLFGTLDEFALLSIPMFLLMGSAIAASRAGSDLYEALDRWLYRVPGGLLISNIGACGLFAALTGSSPATCAAIGKMGIPEMRQRGYPASLATGAIAAGGTLGILIPPSITMIVYGIATETSIGRLFMAGLIPGVMLMLLFMGWSWLYAYRKGYRFTEEGKYFSLRDKLVILPKILPFMGIIVVVLWALYGGVATPSEASGVGAMACILLVMVIYRVWRPSHLWEIVAGATRESVMLMMIIGMAGLFSYMMSSLYITQGIAEWIAGMDVSRWLLLFYVNLFLLVAGFFLPPVAVILMTAPTIVPIIIQAGFDPIWFGVILTLNMEIGLITPPVGLNLYVINGIVKDVDLKTVLWGALPFMLCLVLGIFLLALFPGIVTWLPDYLMGEVR